LEKKLVPVDIERNIGKHNMEKNAKYEKLRFDQ